MKVAVRYYTRSGNTKRLADAVATALGTEAKDISCPVEEKVDILFLGSSYYAFDADPKVKQFIIDNKENVGKLVCFGTSAMMRSMLKPIGRVCKANGVSLSQREFHCRGQFKKANPGRPNADDLQKASEFARSVIEDEG